MTTILFSPPLPTSIMDMCRAMLPPGYELLAGERKDPEFARALPEAEFWMGFARGGLDEAFFKTGKRLKLVQLISAGYDAIEEVDALKALGVDLAIDDFGTGYSSLRYLRRLPLDVMKIEKSFVDGIGRPGEEPALLRAIVDLADIFGLHVVAEGIERPEQRNDGLIVGFFG